SVQGQHYDASGSALGGQFEVNTYTTNNQLYPSVARNGAGDFVVVWQSAGSASTDVGGFSVQAQRYDPSGTGAGAQFQVNSYTTADQVPPAVAIDSAGDFVVVWFSTGSAGGDTSLQSIQGQRYDATGATLGAQFQVNSYTTGNQRSPSVASD